MALFHAIGRRVSPNSHIGNFTTRVERWWATSACRKSNRLCESQSALGGRPGRSLLRVFGRRQRRRGVEVRNEGAELHPEGVPIVRLAEGALDERLNEVRAGGVHRIGRGAEHFGVRRGLYRFVAEEDLFVELLAWANATDDDVDVHPFLESGKADEVVGEVDNLDRLPHVEDEELARLPEGARLQHKLHRFWNGHEVATHLRVGDGHWPSRLDLLEEGGDDGAARAQHVSESHRKEVAAAVLGGGTHDLLGDALGASHYRRGTHGLVRRYQDERLDRTGDRHRDEVGGAEDVVGDGLDDVLLHERHVLVRGGVEDGVGAEPIEHLSEPPGVPQVGDDRHQVGLWEAPAQLVGDLEDLVLAVVQDEELGRGKGRDLAAQFGTDGAPGAGDQHDLASHQLADSGEVGDDGVATKEVLDGDLAQRLHTHSAVDDVADAGNDARGDSVKGGVLDHLANEGALGPRDGDDDLGGLPGLDGVSETG